MTKFKIGDRVFVPKDAGVSYGGRARRNGTGVICQTKDGSGDVRVTFDSDGTYGYVLAKDLKREKVYAQPGDVAVGDKVRVKITYGNGDKSKHDFVVTGVNGTYIHSTVVIASWYPNSGTQTIEILEKAPVPEPEPLKVGDTVSGERQYADLPVGAFVAHHNGMRADALILTGNGWINVVGGGVGAPYLKRTIVWLPEVSN